MERADVEKLCEKQFNANGDKTAEVFWLSIRKLYTIDPFGSENMAGGKSAMNRWNVDVTFPSGELRLKENLVSRLVLVIELEPGGRCEFVN
mmetsp:Transcript_14403/g.28805  ORF Transcript_14403/g.28805 Transcript_14403/m.28805 type:complete len:91 (+) Transcript_14403:565-837(+)|eukprot:CAMPEP_0194321690 /NCGR_PEP_ID=MMETSP0171-20130528/17891_1 /TAXON_ID=218684 /ORGANISM="Corethron pennatum, Strain L29A3" /LENGTH=90 /DNA_ID=CAMNT_0039079687 /DNA_START=274 /DNA_END=546 /DNA_ORIENTATION=-